MTGTEVLAREPGAVVATEAVSFVQMIERASRDPSVDVDKMAKILEMYERTQSRNAETAYNVALAAMQTELPEIPRNGTIKNKAGNVQSKYAKWEDINEIIKPIMSRHGFSLSFRTGNVGAKMQVTGILRHIAGHCDTSTMELPADDSGAKNAVQGLGSSTSYGKRYVAEALLNLISRGEDDGGQGGKALDQSEKERFLGEIEQAKDLKAAEALWQTISAACHKSGDIPAYDELKAAMVKRRKALEGKT